MRFDLHIGACRSEGLLRLQFVYSEPGFLLRVSIPFVMAVLRIRSGPLRAEESMP